MKYFYFNKKAKYILSYNFPNLRISNIALLKSTLPTYYILNTKIDF